MEWPKLRNGLIFLSLFFTGFAGGVYEALFASQITLVVGLSLRAIAITISAFFLGIGIGGYLLGKRTDKYSIEKKMSLFIIIEVLIIALSILGYFFISLLPLIRIFNFSSLFREILNTFIIYLLLFLISFFIGGEIPIALSIKKTFDKEQAKEIGEMTGWANLADAVGGGIAFIIPWFLPLQFGFQGTLFITTLLNFTSIILMGIIFFKTIRPKEIQEEPNLRAESRSKKFSPKIISRKKRKKQLLAFCISYFIIAQLFIFNVGGISTHSSLMLQSFLYGDTLLYSQQSSYQRIDIVNNERWNRLLFLDYDLQLTTADEFFYHEAIVHPALLAHSSPKDVLIIGGGDGGSLRQICKYNSTTVENITLLELDPAVISVSIAWLQIDGGSFSDNRVTVINEDGRYWMQSNPDLFDIIIIDLPDPDTIDLARLYSQEFYNLTKYHLKPNGTIVTQSSSAYYSTLSFVNIFVTISSIFGENFTFPYNSYVPSLGNWGFVMATSNTSLTNESIIESRIQKRGVSFDVFSSSQYDSYFSFPQYIQNNLDAPNPLEEGRVTTDNFPYVLNYIGQDRIQLVYDPITSLVRSIIGPIIILGTMTIIGIIFFIPWRKKKNDLDNNGEELIEKSNIYN